MNPRPLLLIALPLLVFFQALPYGLFWDDISPNLVSNPGFDPPSPGNLLGFWRAPYAEMYIPVTYSLWGGLANVSEWLTGVRFSPWVYHSANLGLHLVNGLLVYTLCRRFVANEWACTAGALLFLVHPLQVEPVVWISGFRGLLAAGFGLGALHLYLAGTDAQRVGDRRSARKRLASGWLLLLLALLSKPSAAVVPLLALAVDVVVRRDSLWASARRLWPWFALPVAVLLATYLLQSSVDAVYRPDSPLWARPLVWSDTLAFYLYKLLNPLGLAISYGRNPASLIGSPWLWFVWLVPVALALLAWRLRGQRVLVLGICLFVLGYAPVAGLIPFGFQYWSTVADRYLYFSMAGAALVLAWGWQVARRPAVRGVMVGFIAFWALWSAAVQVPTWRSGYLLWDRAIQLHPQNPGAYFNRAVLNARNGRWEEALADHQRSLVLTGGYEACGGPVSAPAYRQCVLRNLTRELERQPNNNARLTRAYLLFQSGRREQAYADMAVVVGSNDRQRLEALAAEAWGKKD